MKNIYSALSGGPDNGKKNALYTKMHQHCEIIIVADLLIHSEEVMFHEFKKFLSEIENSKPITSTLEASPHLGLF